MDDEGLTWDRNRERRERLWSKPDAAAPAPEVQPEPATQPVPSLGERVAAREARQRDRAARSGHRLVLPKPRAPGPQQTEDDATLAEHQRPRTRADCVGGERPCPWVGCRHHVYLDVSPDTGSIKINVDREPAELEHSCALDLAERGGMTLEEISETLGVTRERVRQIETRGLRLMQSARSRLT